MTNATLSSSYNSLLVYSNGNLTATQGQTNVNCQAAASYHLLTGNKYYWEVTFNTAGSGFSNNNVCGIVTPNHNFNNSNYIGSDTTGVGYNSGGAVQYNGSTLSTIASYSAGANIGIAVDFVNNEIYFRVNGGNWNNNGSANPATNTGGISISTFATAMAYCLPALGFYFNGQQETINLGNSSFSYTAPSGFSSPSSWPPNIAANSAVPSSVSYSIIGGTTYKGFNPTVSARTQLGIGAQINGAPMGGQFSPAGNITHVSGLVEESSVDVSGKTVRAYDSVTGVFLGYAVSDSGGAWSIPALGRLLVDASARDDPNYDGLIYVRITPG